MIKHSLPPSDSWNAARPMVAGAFLVWSLAALWSLAQQAWRTEAGSLAPLVIILGVWSLIECRRRNKHLARIGSVGLALAVICFALPAYIVASAIDMVVVMALCVWAAGIATFYYLNGLRLTVACAFPLGFLGLAIPLPYSLSASGNSALRDFVATAASSLGVKLNLEVAVNSNFIFIDQYKLAIDSACAGVSSTMSLVAIGLLFAHWMQKAGWRSYLVAIGFAVPIALFANVLRILALVILVRAFGPRLLDTAIHPISGMLSFIFALAMFSALQRVIAILSEDRKR